MDVDGEGEGVGSTFTCKDASNTKSERGEIEGGGEEEEEERWKGTDRQVGSKERALQHILRIGNMNKSIAAGVRFLRIGNMNKSMRFGTSTRPYHLHTATPMGSTRAA